MSFKNIKGQDSAIKFLKGALENNRIAHSYIFLGPGGVGKKLTAVNFAKALNCNAVAGGESCGVCNSCKKIDNSNHPDVFMLSPEKEGSSIKIDSMRELIKSIGLKPYEGRKKVYIIDEAPAMTQEASNAILKTLEEPPPDSVMILIAENLNTLLQTIVSRSQVIRFFPLGALEVKTILVKQYSIDDVKAHILSHLFSGRLGEAVRHKEEDFFSKRGVLLNGLLKNTFFDNDFEKISKEDLRLYLDIMLAWYRDILAVKAGLPASMLVNIDKEMSISGEAKRFRMDYLNKVINQIILTNSFLDRNANPKLAMGALAISVREY